MTDDKVEIRLSLSRTLAITLANKLREERVLLTRISNQWAADLRGYDPESDPWIYANRQADFFSTLADEAWNAAKEVVHQTERQQ